MAFFVFTGEWLAVGWLRCPFGVPFVSCHSCVLTDCPGRYLLTPFLIIMGVVGVLFGRAFCGWGCPMGLVEDVLGKLPKPGNRFKASFAKVDRALKWLKWPALVLVVWAVFAYNYPADHRPYEYMTRSPSVFNIQAIGVAWGLGGGPYKIHFGILVVALAGALLISRFWCRYLCPLGTLQAVFNKFSIFRLRKDKLACTDCGKYPRECLQYTVPGTTDCVMCGDCAQGCASKSITFGPRYSIRQPAAPKTETAAEP